MDSIVICLPTYNEKENLPLTVAAIRDVLPNASILVIDDNSPDGTGDVAEGLSREYPGISVCHRPGKKGLCRAYLDGFRRVLDRPDVDLIIQMDADLSHPPDRLPAMIRAAETADLVIGSRYVPGGGTCNWNFVRRVISRFGSFYARTWLGLPVMDPTGGFKVWKRLLLERIMHYPITASGYAFQVETTWIAFRLNARIVEVPFVFNDRNLGSSKMSLAITMEACWRVPLLRLKH